MCFLYSHFFFFSRAFHLLTGFVVSDLAVCDRGFGLAFSFKQRKLHFCMYLVFHFHDRLPTFGSAVAKFGEDKLFAYLMIHFSMAEY